MHGLLEVALGLEVFSAVDHERWPGLQSEGHELGVQSEVLGEADGVVEALGDGVVMDGLLNFVDALQVTRQEVTDRHREGEG